MTKRIFESGTVSVDPKTKAFRVTLISEGIGSSAEFRRTFFNQFNADALAESLSFPGHPENLDRPELRNPMSAIGTVGPKVDVHIDETTGNYSFVSEYMPAKSKPEVQPYLEEFADKLGLSIYIDSDGFEDPDTGRWIVETIDGADPYKSVDLVVAAGRGGKFDRAAESLRRIKEASASAEEKEINMEIKDVEKIVADAVTPLKLVVEGLAATLEGKAKADLQVEADKTAVDTAVASRLAEYDKAVVLISEAKLTESQSEGLRALALAGEDITKHVETAKKVLAEARATAGDDTDAHLGGGATKVAESFSVAGFGEVN
jgi:hypothetical protein